MLSSRLLPRQRRVCGVGGGGGGGEKHNLLKMLLLTHTPPSLAPLRKRARERKIFLFISYSHTKCVCVRFRVKSADDVRRKRRREKFSPPLLLLIEFIACLRVWFVVSLRSSWGDDMNNVGAMNKFCNFRGRGGKRLMGRIEFNSKSSR
jgi:hypothetical protein